MLARETIIATALAAAFGFGSAAQAQTAPSNAPDPAAPRAAAPQAATPAPQAATPAPQAATPATPAMPHAATPATPAPRADAAPATPAPGATAPATTGATTPNAPAEGGSRAAERTAPLVGANSFTEGQARSRITGAGFAEVQDLNKDEQGIWRGRATRNGQQTGVAMDYQGNVVATP